MNFSKKNNKKDKSNLSFISKTIIKNLILIPLILFSFLFTGCQEEFNEIIIGSDEEILVADSYVVSLMKNTVTKDGSSDNILDNANCFTIQLPVHVTVNDLEIIVDSEEDFDVIEKIFDEYYDDDDYLEYVYPIVITLSDYTDITIENKAQLEGYKAACKKDDDDIECVDFKYPLSYSVFNRKENTVKTVEINSDKEMYHFIKKLGQADIVSINFPITLIYTDGAEVEINDMSGLEHAIEEGATFCDEDDDNDYGSDDFTKERLDNLLIICPWIVHDVRRNNNNLTDTYREYLMVFNENGTVKVRARNGDIITGDWTTRVSDRGAMIKLEFDSFVDFTLEWFVHDIDHGRIKLITENGNRIILEKKCDIVFNHTKERIKEFLQECHWRITRLQIDGTDKEDQYIGTPLKFFENGIVHLRINGKLVQGQWSIITPNNKDHILTMSFDGRPDLKLHWKIEFLSKEIIKLTNKNSKLILKRFCADDDDITDINQILNEGEWMVALYETIEGNKTVIFEEFTIDFLENGGIYVEGNNEIIDGSWLTFRNDGKLKLGLNFGLEPPFDQLNYRWKILEINDERIKLVDFAHDGSIERTLVLEMI